MDAPPTAPPPSPEEPEVSLRYGCTKSGGSELTAPPSRRLGWGAKEPGGGDTGLLRGSPRISTLFGGLCGGKPAQEEADDVHKCHRSDLWTVTLMQQQKLHSTVVHTCTNMHTQTHSHIRTTAHMHICMPYACMHAHAHRHAHKHSHTHTCTRIHTHTCGLQQLC